MPSKKNRQTEHNEVEVKLRVDDCDAMIRRLRKLNARLSVPRNHEMNTLYDTPDRSLMRNGQMLRIRVERRAPGVGRRGKAVSPPREKPGALLTYKGPVQGAEEEIGNARPTNSYKIRQEKELRIADSATLTAILEALGLCPIFRYEKYRSTYSLPRTGSVKVELDETPAGNFLELEGTPKAIDRAAALLGYRREDYITKSYGALWMERSDATSGGETGNRSRTAGDMLF